MKISYELKRQQYLGDVPVKRIGPTPNFDGPYAAYRPPITDAKIGKVFQEYLAFLKI
jgi:hypothetical protein